MSLMSLYNLKLNEYRETGVREKPQKLLAILLLSEKDKYMSANCLMKKFYEVYKDDIDKKIEKIESDFDLASLSTACDDEQEILSDNYEHDKVWLIYADAISALAWGLIYENGKTGEEIYFEYFENGDSAKVLVLKRR